MAEVIIIAVVAYLLGWGFQRPFILPSHSHIGALIAMSVGFAVWSIVAAMVLVSGLPFSPILVFGISVVGISLINITRRTDLSRDEVMVFGAGGILTGVVAAIAANFDPTILTSDGMFVLTIGRQLFESQHVLPSMQGTLASFAIFLSLIHTAGLALETDYLPGLPALFTMQMIAAFIGAAFLLIRDECGHHWVALLYSFAGAFMLMTSVALLWHGSLFKASAIFGCYLFLSCTLAVLAVRQRHVGWIWIAVPLMASMALMRMESGLLIAPLLVVLISTREIPKKTRMITVAVLGAAYATWFAFVVIKSFGHGLFTVYQLTVIGALPAAIAAGGIALCFFSSHTRFYWAGTLLHRLPYVMLASLGLIIVAYVVVRPDQAWRGLSAVACYASTSKNGVAYFWGVVFVGYALAWWRLPRGQAETLIVLGAFGFIMVVLAIAVQTPWKACAPTDSGNRLLTQIMPVILFPLIVWFGRLSYRGHRE